MISVFRALNRVSRFSEQVAPQQTSRFARSKTLFHEAVSYTHLARQDYNLTEVANMLFTSQSGVSRHIRELEDELGIEIFVRRGKRLLGMTEPGKALLVLSLIHI